MNYPEWWQRLVAGIIDGIILAIVGWIIMAILTSIAWPNIGAMRALGFIGGLIYVGIIVGYKVFFEAGKWQATPGKMVFGLKVVDEAGNRLQVGQALIRTWPWWLNLITALGALLLLDAWLNLLVALAIIAIFFTFFAQPVGRCIHDQTAKANVIKAEKGMIETPSPTAES